MQKNGVYRVNFRGKPTEYKSFSPSFINTSHSWQDDETSLLLDDATRSLAELNAYSYLIPDADFYIKMHVAKEANLSSRIEGTKTEITDIVLPRSEVKIEKQNDWAEVHNYIDALNFAISSLNRLPLSVRLLKDTHKVLMSGVRGENKCPGEIRKTQNWIGGSSLQNAFFVPPHPSELAELLTDFEKFLNSTDYKLPVLIKAAISHYQFETIHPFCDGNGRLGRLLIILLLVDHKHLFKPSLYLSAYFDKNRPSYYEGLNMARDSGGMKNWIRFFLRGIVESSESGKETLKKILAMRSNFSEIAKSLGRRSDIALRLLDKLYSSPSMSINDIKDALNVEFITGARLVDIFVQKGILKETTGMNKNRIFTMTEYLELFR